jgi:hypothetical protein
VRQEFQRNFDKKSGLAAKKCFIVADVSPRVTDGVYFFANGSTDQRLPVRPLLSVKMHEEIEQGGSCKKM